MPIRADGAALSTHNAKRCIHKRGACSDADMDDEKFDQAFGRAFRRAR